MGLKEVVWWFKIFQMRMAMKKCTFFWTVWPKRAEQWSRSADGARKGKNQRSVIQAALLGLGHASQTLTYNGGQQWMEAEGNSQHAIIKTKPSILVTKAMRYRQTTPRIHRFQCQKVISVGQLEIINLWVSNLYHLYYFCVTAFTCTFTVIRNHCWNIRIQLFLEGGDIFVLVLFLIGKHLYRHFNIF